MAELTAESVQDMINKQTMQNNAWSAEQAQKQMDFQREMSNTAYQRQVADLKAAGLNPALIYSNGSSGAATSAGAMAQTDTSNNAALTNFLVNLIQTKNQIELQEANAKLQHELTDKTNALSRYIAELQSQTSIYGYDIGYAGIMDAKEYDWEHPKSMDQLAAKLTYETGKSVLGTDKTSDVVEGTKQTLKNVLTRTNQVVNNSLNNLAKYTSGFKVGIDRLPLTNARVLLNQLQEEMKWLRNKGLTASAYQKIRLLAMQGYNSWSASQKRYIRNYEYKKGIKKSVLDYKK